MSDSLRQGPPGGGNGRTGDFDEEQRPDQDPRWGRDLRLYTERCVRDGDAQAAESIRQLIKPFIRWLVKSFPAEHLDDATRHLTGKAFIVLLQRYDRAEHLGAYLKTSLVNERNSMHKRMKRDLGFLKSLDAMSEWQRDGLENRQSLHQGGDLLESNRAIDEVANKHIRQCLKAFIEEAGKRRDPVLIAISKVLERCYRTGENITEAARELGYSEREIRTIQQRWSRERKNPNSRLSKLAREILHDDDDDDNVDGVIGVEKENDDDG